MSDRATNLEVKRPASAVVPAAAMPATPKSEPEGHAGTVVTRAVVIGIIRIGAVAVIGRRRIRIAIARRRRTGRTVSRLLAVFVHAGIVGVGISRAHIIGGMAGIVSADRGS